MRMKCGKNDQHQGSRERERRPVRRRRQANEGERARQSEPTLYEGEYFRRKNTVASGRQRILIDLVDDGRCKGERHLRPHEGRATVNACW